MSEEDDFDEDFERYQHYARMEQEMLRYTEAAKSIPKETFLNLTKEAS